MSAAVAALTISAFPAEARGDRTPAFDKLAQNNVDKVERGTVPGVFMAVVRSGRVIAEQSVGFRDIQSRAPLDRKTVIQLRSLTKPVIAVAAMMLVERGQLRLEDPVARYIPCFARLRVLDEDGTGRTPKRPMLVRDLLSHKSGFTYQPNGETSVHRAYRRAPNAMIIASFPTLAEAAQAACSVPLLFDPGDGWEYGISTDLLGRVIEVASGASLQTFLEHNLFAPLGMTDTGFVVRPSQRDRFAAIYDFDGRSLVRLQAYENSPLRTAARAPSGGGGLVSTPADMLRFATMLSNGGTLGGRHYLKRATLRAMGRNQLSASTALPEWTRPMSGYGLGFGVTGMPCGQERKILFWGGSAQTYLWVDLQNRLAGLWLSQAYITPFSFGPMADMLAAACEDRL